VWNLCGLVPESSFLPRLSAAVFVAIGVAACGPAGGGGIPASYVIQFTLSEAPADLTLLDFTVDYTGGDFVGEGTAVACERATTTTGDSDTFEDDDNGTLTVHIGAPTHKLTAPVLIVKCDFKASTQPTSNNFDISVDDAEPSDPADVSVVVTSTDPASSSSLGEVTE
jgi:hypothetical protein